MLCNSPRGFSDVSGGGIASVGHSSTSRDPRCYLYRQGVVHGSGAHTKARDQAEGARFDVCVAGWLRLRPRPAKKKDAE